MITKSLGIKMTLLVALISSKAFALGAAVPITVFWVGRNFIANKKQARAMVFLGTAR